MNCIFCKIIESEIPSYTIYENEYVKCFLDVNPISNAHTLIVPKKHFKDMYDIDEKYLIEINKAAKLLMELYDEKLKPNGYRILSNNGVLQEVKHYHMHLIPNYSKKSSIKVEDVYKKLTK